MSSKKVFSGEEFSGTDTLDVSDISDWVVDGTGGEVAKTALDDFDWDGSVVMGIVIKTSPDNRKVVGGNIFLMGEFMRATKENIS